MKKRLKRIVLSRETLIQLDQKDVRPAVGRGVTTPPDCDFSNNNNNTCFTQFGNTCRTNFC